MSELMERDYHAPRLEVDKGAPILPAAQQTKTVSVEELEAHFALPAIDEPEIASKK